MDHWPQVTAHLASHDGLIGRDALRRIGVDRHELARWISTGRLERCAPRVWRLVGAPPTWRQQLTCGLLTLGGTAAVSHAAAAALHQLDRFPQGPVEFLVPRASRNSRHLATVHSTRNLPRSDTLTVDGLRTTTATRTIIDLAATDISDETLGAAIASAVHRQLSSPLALAKRLDGLRRSGRGGVTRLERELIDSGGESFLEREFLRLVRAAGLPRPTTQARIAADGRSVARVDFLFAACGLVVEVSGRLGHSSPSERTRDAQRRNELQALGLTVYEFTWQHVTQRPAWVLDQLRSQLSARRGGIRGLV